MTSSLATSTATISCDVTMFPTFTHGDASSVIFIVAKGPSAVKLRADEAKLNSGELTSCTGDFTIKFTTGEPRKLLCRHLCQIGMRIDLINEADCGLIISGEIISMTDVAPLRVLPSFQDSALRSDLEAQLRLLQPGARVRLIHRGAASDGAIMYIQDPTCSHIHLPYVPADIKQAKAAPPCLPNDKPTGRIHTHAAPYRNTRGIPYRY